MVMHSCAQTSRPRPYAAKRPQPACPAWNASLVEVVGIIDFVIAITPVGGVATCTKRGVKT